jgi:hypothetical protein
VIEATQLTSDRYSLTRPLGAGRYFGRDQRLERDVLLWVFAPEDDVERAAVTDLASTFARLTHPVFLQTLDLVGDQDRVAVVLEAPMDGEETSEHPLAGGLPALVAATLTLRIGTALEEAAQLGLAAEELPLTYVHVSGADEVRLDPVGLLRETVEESSSGLVPLLTEFLASFLPDVDGAHPARSRFDPGADAALSLVGRWRERVSRDEADELDDVAAFLDELRLIARPPADFYVEDDAGFKRSADNDSIVLPPAVNPDEEETVPLQLPAATPARGAAVPRRAGGPTRPARGYETATIPRHRGRQAMSPVSWLLTVVGFGLIATLGVVLVVVGLQLRDDNSPAGAVVDGAQTATASPTPAPANRATLTVAAQQDAQVRVTVDGAPTPAFAGVLKAGESRSWEGGSRVQLWTNNGKNLTVTVNGFPLGALSPAVGHPDWNTVDWGWNAGWRPS